MITIKGYSEISYTAFNAGLKKIYKASAKNIVTIAYELEVKSQTTINNAFNIKEQIVSDQLLSKIVNHLSYPVILVYTEGEKKYYIMDSFKKKHL